MNEWMNTNKEINRCLNWRTRDGTFQGQRNQMMEQIMQMKITWSCKDPNWQEADRLVLSTEFSRWVEKFVIRGTQVL